MGLLDKAGASTDEKKPTVAKAVAKAPEPVAVASAKKAKPAKAVKAKKVKGPRPRPMGLAEDYELASKMNRRISWLVNFVINFGVLFAALFIMISDTNVVTTILVAVSGVIIILNGIFIPMKFSRNLGQFVSRTKFIRGDGTNPLFLHGILVNMSGLLSLVGIILVFTQFQNLNEADNTGAIIMFSLGAIFIIMWFIDRFLRNGSEMGKASMTFSSVLIWSSTCPLKKKRPRVFGPASKTWGTSATNSLLSKKSGKPRRPSKKHNLLKTIQRLKKTDGSPKLGDPGALIP